MKRIVIVSPHFPPSNLAAVHRARLFAKHLPSLGWEPYILTVQHQYYEENLDWNLQKLVDTDLKIITVKAFSAGPVRVIGDIGLRAFPFLLKKLKELVTKENIDFLYIPIPSFYAALLGRAIHAATKVPYGIDYIDPWVHTFAGSEKRFSRHWWSTKLSALLEPIAVKKAALITGVAEGYYLPVFQRNQQLKTQALHIAMPYGGEADDHAMLSSLHLQPYLFPSSTSRYRLVYAGAMLPKAYSVLEQVFKALNKLPLLCEQIEFQFIGTGKRANDPQSYSIKPLAEKYSLWQTVVYEYPERIPYLDVLTHFSTADAIFILGSTEPHYTPSKVYQGILSKRPLLAVLHQESSAAQVIRQSNAGLVLTFNGEQDVEKIGDEFGGLMYDFKKYAEFFDSEQVNKEAFEEYSAFSVTKKLAEALDRIIVR
jgi:hypothetical protein